MIGDRELNAELEAMVANDNDKAKRITIRSVADNWCGCGPDDLPCGLWSCRHARRRL